MNELFIEEKSITQEVILRKTVEQVIQGYFMNLDGQPAQDLYQLVIKEVELGLLRAVLDLADGNQSLAAKWLGLARNTLRKKLSLYGLD